MSTSLPSLLPSLPLSPSLSSSLSLSLSLSISLFLPLPLSLFSYLSILTTVYMSLYLPFCLSSIIDAVLSYFRPPSINRSATDCLPHNERSRRVTIAARAARAISVRFVPQQWRRSDKTEANNEFTTNADGTQYRNGNRASVSTSADKWASIRHCHCSKYRYWPACSTLKDDRSIWRCAQQKRKQCERLYQLPSVSQPLNQQT